MSGQVNESGRVERVKSRRKKCILFVRIQLACQSIYRGVVGLYRQSKVFPPTA